jgi:hypothetical protein
MMRLLRRATLLVAFSLLTSATTASAECAWVLWSNFYSTNPASPIEGLWAPEMAFKTQPACEADASRRKKQSGGGKRQRQETGESVLTHTCLPDTVDPRGPKGK